LHQHQLDSSTYNVFSSSLFLTILDVKPKAES